MKTLTFTVSIAAPPPLVWDTMLGADTYRKWVVPFCEGTYFEGSWDKGATIRFLAPSGDGLVAEIADNRRHEFVSVRHLGEIRDGVEDTQSDAVRAWAPAYENFRFAETPDGTEVTVQIDTLPEGEQFMRDIYPKALEVLKGMCEAG